MSDLKQKFERYAKEHETFGGLLDFKHWKGFYKIAEDHVADLKHLRWHQFKRLLKSSATKEQLIRLMDKIEEIKK